MAHDAKHLHALPVLRVVSTFSHHLSHLHMKRSSSLQPGQVPHRESIHQSTAAVLTTATKPKSAAQRQAVLHRQAIRVHRANTSTTGRARETAPLVEADN